ncbi:MAG: MoaD/ThiS family protein [Candidatus Desulfacyla sp.]
MDARSMMKIEFRLYASLSRYMPEEWRKSPAVEIREGATVKELLESVKVPLDGVKVIFINGVHARVDAALRDGDRVGVFPPVAGG